MAAYELKYTAEEIDGILESVDEKTIYDDATQSEHGLMSTTDKAKLDTLPDGKDLADAFDLKVDKKVPSTAGNIAKLTGEGNIADSGYRIDDFATEQQGRLADTAYQKPSSGIPKTDLASSVQTSLGKADTALQEHQDISGKQDTLVSGTNIKTVNGESLLGSGNIEIQGGGGEENVIEAITMNGSSVPVTNKTAAITETDPTVPSWAKQQNKPSYNYSEIGNTPDLSGFITKSVNDLTNYYLKSETYTKEDVNALIRAIQQFHYEIYATLPQSGESNVLYLVGPTGSGSDRYEEYVYSNNTFTKIGDTSIDLSGYVTTSALNTALADYATTRDLEDALENTPYYTYVEDEGGVLGDDTEKPFSFIKTESGDVYAIGEQNSGGMEDWVLATTNYVDNAIGGLADVATSGSYNDLSDKPTIPTVSVQDVTVGGTSVVSNGTAVIPAIPDVSSMYKTGVISQTQTWSGTGTQPRTYVMSDLVYGTIPQANIDLFESAGAIFNATTGYFELNGLTDISYEEMQKIYSCSIAASTLTNTRSMAFATPSANFIIRCTLPLRAMTSFATNFSYLCYGANVIEQVNIEATYLSATSALSYAFQNAYCLKKIGNGYMDYIGGANDNAFKNCYSLETVYLRKLKANMKFNESPNLSMESIAYMVANAGTDNITITLHPTAYNAAIVNTDVTAALQTKTNVSLASA